MFFNVHLSTGTVCLFGPCSFQDHNLTVFNQNGFYRFLCPSRLPIKVLKFVLSYLKMKV